MSKKKKRAAVVGIAQTKVQRELDGSVKDVAHQLIREALDDAGLTLDQIDGLYTGPPGMGGLPSFMFVCALADYLGVSTRSMAMVECGGGTSTACIKFAINEIELGYVNYAVVFNLDRKVTGRMRTEFEHFLRGSVTSMINLYGPYDGVYGVGAPIPVYAISTQRYMYEYGVAAEDIAQVAVQLRDNATKNPDALYRKPMTVEDVLNSPMPSPPIHLFECSVLADAASVVILASPEAAKETKKQPIYITGIGESHHPSHFIPTHASITSFESAVRASLYAYEDAGIKPADIDVAEVYGVFAGTELMIYEDLGFFEKGKAAYAVKDGKTALDGEVAMNPSGGRLSFGHPAGATPAMELIEIVKQLRGEAGDRQVKGAEVGMYQSEHGMLNGATVMILEH